MGALLQWLTDARAKQPDRFYCLVACLSDAWRLKFQEIGVFVCEELTRAIATMAAIRDMSVKSAQAATDLPKLAPIPHDSEYSLAASVPPSNSSSRWALPS